MIFIRVNDDNRVSYINYMPFDEENGLKKTREELSREGYLVDSIPEIPRKQGYVTLMKFEPVKGFYFEYEEIVESEEEIQLKKLAELEGAVMELSVALTSLVGGVTNV